MLWPLASTRHLAQKATVRWIFSFLCERISVDQLFLWYSDQLILHQRPRSKSAEIIFRPYFDARFELCHTVCMPECLEMASECILACIQTKSSSVTTARSLLCCVGVAERRDGKKVEPISNIRCRTSCRWLVKANSWLLIVKMGSAH